MQTKDNMNRLLLLAGEVHARAAARAAANQPAANVHAAATNGDAGGFVTTAPEALTEATGHAPEGPAEAVAAPERRPKGVPKGVPLVTACCAVTRTEALHMEEYGSLNVSMCGLP